MEFSKDNFKFYCLTRHKLNVSATVCYEELKQAYPDDSPSRATVFRWFNDFEEKCNQAAVHLPLQPTRGRPRTSRTPQTIDQVQQFLTDDNRVTVRQLSEWLEVSKTTIHEILTEDLKLRNVSCVWVPHELQDNHKLLRVNCAKQIRRIYFREGLDALCNKLAIQDETWFYLNPQVKKQSNRCWLADGEKRPQLVKRSISDKKIMLLVAFTPNKRFSITALPPGDTVDGECIINFLKHTGNLWRSLRSNPVHMSDLLWQWDNARPHSSALVREYMETTNMQLVFQSPYSPDFNLCDRFLFNWMKTDFQNRDFATHTELQDAALQWGRGLQEESLRTEVQKLIDHCQVVIDLGGSYATN